MPGESAQTFLSPREVLYDVSFCVFAERPPPSEGHPSVLALKRPWVKVTKVKEGVLGKTQNGPGVTERPRPEEPFSEVPSLPPRRAGLAVSGTWGSTVLAPSRPSGIPSRWEAGEGATPTALCSTPASAPATALGVTASFRFGREQLCRSKASVLGRAQCRGSQAA